MWTVVEARSQKMILLAPMSFDEALKWYVYYTHRYCQLEFDMIPVTVH